MNTLRVVFLLLLPVLTIGETMINDLNPVEKLLGRLPNTTNLYHDPIDCKEFNSTWGQFFETSMTTNRNSIKDLKVRFLLSSRLQRKRIEVFPNGSFPFTSSAFRIERRTVIIVHGFIENNSTWWVKKMEDAFLRWRNVNVVVVDWTTGRKFNYYDAVGKSKFVGWRISRFLQGVRNATINAASLETPKWGFIHIVGHSLGAHIAGIAARNFTSVQNDWEVKRITALDPAGLCFGPVLLEFRLDRTDASFVDVIHTGAGSKTAVGFGHHEPIGHVDFYANGGKDQPGCRSWSPFIEGYCNHERSHVYFIESFNIIATKRDCRLWAYPWDPSNPNATTIPSGHYCESPPCMQMGILAENKYQEGTFYVVVPGKKPYCVMRGKKTKKFNTDYWPFSFEER